MSHDLSNDLWGSQEMTVFASRALIVAYLEDMSVVSISGLLRQAYTEGNGGKMLAIVAKEVVKLPDGRREFWDAFIAQAVPVLVATVLEDQELFRLRYKRPKATKR